VPCFIFKRNGIRNCIRKVGRRLHRWAVGVAGKPRLVGDVVHFRWLAVAVVALVAVVVAVVSVAVVAATIVDDTVVAVVA